MFNVGTKRAGTHLAACAGRESFLRKRAQRQGEIRDSGSGGKQNVT